LNIIHFVRLCVAKKSAAKIESAVENPPLRLLFSLFQNSFKCFAADGMPFLPEMNFSLAGATGPAVSYLCCRLFANN